MLPEARIEIVIDAELRRRKVLRVPTEGSESATVEVAAHSPEWAVTVSDQPHRGKWALTHLRTGAVGTRCATLPEARRLMRELDRDAAEWATVTERGFGGSRERTEHFRALLEAAKDRAAQRP